jgi:hypothetical protein
MEIFCCVVGMSNQYTRPKDPNFRNVHDRIRNDPRIWPHFKDCIGAIDGTHICANPPPQDFLRYLGRSGKATQNVMAVVDCVSPLPLLVNLVPCMIQVFSIMLYK